MKKKNKKVFKAGMLLLAGLLSTGIAVRGVFAATQNIVTAGDVVTFIADKQINATITFYASKDDTLDTTGDSADTVLGTFTLARNESNNSRATTTETLPDIDTQMQWVHGDDGLTAKTYVIVTIKNNREDDAKIKLEDKSSITLQKVEKKEVEAEDATFYTLPTVDNTQVEIAPTATKQIVYEYAVNGLADVYFKNVFKYTLNTDKTHSNEAA